MNVALYLRASTIKQTEEGYSLSYQRDKLVGYADLKDWKIVDEYEDAGESGRTTKRPAFNRMVDDAQKNLFQAVLVYKLDRFSRSLQDLLNVITILQKHNVAVWSVTQSYDDSTPEGRLMRNMLGSFAQFEAEMIGARVKDGMARRAREGEWNTSPPFGYHMNKGLKIDHNEQEVVEEIYRSYTNEDMTMQQIADLLNDSRTTKRGKKFNVNTVGRILRNPIYFGRMRYGGELIITDYPTIISEELFKKAEAIRISKCRKRPMSA